MSIVDNINESSPKLQLEALHHDFGFITHMSLQNNILIHVHPTNTTLIQLTSTNDLKSLPLACTKSFMNESATLAILTSPIASYLVNVRDASYVPLPYKDVTSAVWVGIKGMVSIGNSVYEVPSLKPVMTVDFLITGMFYSDKLVVLTGLDGLVQYHLGEETVLDVTGEGRLIVAGDRVAWVTEVGLFTARAEGAELVNVSVIPCERGVVSLGILPFHIMLLYTSKIVLLDTLRPSESGFEMAVPDLIEGEILKDILVDDGVYYLITTLRVFEVFVEREFDGVWRILMSKKQFEKAAEYATVEEKRIIAKEYFEHLVKVGQEEKACRVFIEGGLDVEEGLLRMGRVFIEALLNSTSGPSTKSMVLSAWLLEYDLSASKDLNDLVKTKAKTSQFVRKHAKQMDTKLIDCILKQHNLSFNPSDVELLHQIKTNVNLVIKNSHRLIKTLPAELIELWVHFDIQCKSIIHEYQQLPIAHKISYLQRTSQLDLLFDLYVDTDNHRASDLLNDIDLIKAYHKTCNSPALHSAIRSKLGGVKNESFVEHKTIKSLKSGLISSLKVHTEDLNAVKGRIDTAVKTSNRLLKEIHFNVKVIRTRGTKCAVCRRVVGKAIDVFPCGHLVHVACSGIKCPVCNNLDTALII